MKTGCVLVGLAAAASIASAAPVNINFDRITNSSAPNVANQWTVTTDSVAGRSVFRFERVGNSSVALAQIYFNGMTGLLTSPTLRNSAGVSYAAGANPAHPPSFNNFNANFNFERAKKGGIHNAVNAPGEFLEISFAYAPGVTQLQVSQALSSLSLRIAMHVQSIGDQSDTYASIAPPPIPKPTPPPVIPLPPAVWSAGLCGLGVLGMVAHRKRRLAR